VTLSVSNGRNGDAGTERQRLLVWGFAVLLVVITGGTLFIARAINRELAVARQQADFVAAVSHEFRTPVTSIHHLAELLAKARMTEPAQVQTAYGMIASESERLKRLIESILDFGRMQGRTFPFRLEAMDVNEWARGVVEEFRASGTGVSFAGPEGAAMIMGDQEALRGAMWNLLENAVKYSPAGTHIQVRVELREQRVEISVEDEGMGIPKAEQGRIFSRFYRGEAARVSGTRGTGIGLALVKEIAEGHGGSARVESEPAKGSVFTLSLPRGR
jgi:signal transduction histidine kinase